jgi:hypothetical protein
MTKFSNAIKKSLIVGAFSVFSIVALGLSPSGAGSYSFGAQKAEASCTISHFRVTKDHAPIFYFPGGEGVITVKYKDKGDIVTGPVNGLGPGFREVYLNGEIDPNRHYYMDDSTSNPDDDTLEYVGCH